ncbi:MAG: hypothetical protein FJ385_06345 [Verrucomicrobia bacterium]|nr:hypothetical protein [Verrucomicrobiota bacterium]
MKRMAWILTLLVAASASALADHVIVTGGPALRKWEDLRVQEDRHDRWWANFVRASTLRMAELRTAGGPSAPIVWFVFKPGYVTRGREDGKPYVQWITEQAQKRRVPLIWFDSGPGFIKAFNARPRGSVKTLDFFGHSNRHAFMFDYGNDIIASSTAWLHEREIPRLRRAVFARGAHCRSWGCHTGESMSSVWRQHLGVPLEGVKGPTDYRPLSFGRMPEAKGPWTM